MAPHDVSELPEPAAAEEPTARRGPAGPKSLDPEAALARRARGGDRDAFAELYRRRAPMVHGVLIGMVPPQDAGDLVQEVFLRALRSVGELRGESVGPWLCAIARNCARDAARSRRAEVPLAAGAEPCAEPASAGDDEDEARRALAGLRELPAAYRETLGLRLVEGLTGPEIAAATGMTHGSVRVNLHRGLKLLRERLAETGRRDGERGEDR